MASSPIVSGLGLLRVMPQRHFCSPEYFSKWCNLSRNVLFTCIVGYFEFAVGCIKLVRWTVVSANVACLLHESVGLGCDTCAASGACSDRTFLGPASVSGPYPLQPLQPSEALL